MIPSEQTVYIVEDDNVDRSLVCALILAIIGLACKGFTSATKFLAQYDPHDAGCLVLNMVMPDTDGLTMQH